METFRLFHVLLYAKHWYKRFDKLGRGERKTIFDDLRKCFTADGYMGECMSRYDVVDMLLINCQRVKLSAFSDLRQFANGVSDREVWKNGYFTKTNDVFNKNRDNNPDYDYETAIVYYCLSNLACSEIKYLGIDKLPEPDFKNCLPRRNGITDKSIKRMFDR